MTSLFTSGLELLGLGMGIVFLFLTLLVILVSAMSWIIQRFFAEAAPAASARPQPAPPTEEDELIAAISAAVHRYRHRSR
ncbi:oxaloacetate decarboxylase (Na+ extruding) subunit gamma [Methylomarinovum tepidoasis]|uniref:Probable oxaloacetate decarboxylase gamma chain n=1 Tax=Methylomarinovum tepidoasis TaxID=2840183 RepID=A0AAU9D368_9GAMM|nr:OadG family protein [Methylomarinovum sp. IN45]BCX89409.1 oxaloacetate decarboxylase (Na+ extruding) subunit gamma [Methylomarinovum sp. IN45]